MRKGIDWTAWAVANKDGEIAFGKESYENGTALGMFVEVR